jgi:hypothetical protein
LTLFYLPALEYLLARERRETRTNYREELDDTDPDTTRRLCYPCSATSEVAASESSARSDNVRQLPGAVPMPSLHEWKHSEIQKHRDFLTRLSTMPEPVEPGDFEAYLEEVSTAFHHDRIRLDAESFKPQCDPELCDLPLVHWFSNQQRNIRKLFSQF